jgi:serine/threonine protein kinase
MQAQLLKGSNAEYFFFPQEEGTILSKTEFSTVYLAAEKETKQKLICKELSPTIFSHSSDKLKYFINAFIAIQHPGIAKNFDLIVESNRIFLMQEFVDGVSLKDLIKNKKYYDYTFNFFFYRVIARTLEVVDAIHQAGYCHTDLKPSNIMIPYVNGKINFDNPKVKIIDLSLVKPAFKQGPLDHSPKRHSVLYVSPEQVFNFPELVGDHTDIYTLGTVLYECIAKEPALDVSSPMMIKKLQTVKQFQKHYRFDDELFYVITKSTFKPALKKSEREYNVNQVKMHIIKSLETRYQNVGQFKSDIEKLLSLG